MNQSTDLPLCVSCRENAASDEYLKMPLCDECYTRFSSSLGHQVSTNSDDSNHLLENQSRGQGATFKKEVRSPALDKIKSQRTLG